MGCEAVVTPRYRICAGCGRVVAFEDVKSRRFCVECSRRDNARRNAKAKAAGRTTAAWRRIRAAVLERDGFRCRRCGARRGLTAHFLKGGMAGPHTANLADYVTLCQRCHGSVDAPRAKRQAGESGR